MSVVRQFSEQELRMVQSALCFFRSEKKLSRERKYPVYSFVSDCVGVPMAAVKRIAAMRPVASPELPSADKVGCKSHLV